MLLFDGNKLNLFLPYAGWDVDSVLGAFALLRCVVLCGDQTMKASRMMVSVSDAVVQGK